MNARYEWLAPIATGGMATVFKARDRETGREVAVKRIVKEKAGGCGSAVDALVREARHQSALHHPNIVAVHDFGVDAEGGFIVMELVQGETLEEAVQREALPPADFDALVRQTLAGMSAAHAKGILHLDLKPGNLMLCRPQEGPLQVKILDFGLAKNSSQMAACEGGLAGSVYFMAPEQFERAAATARTDIYALGCIFYYALTQQHPFGGELAPQVMVAHLHHRIQPLEKLRPDLPAAIVQWVKWLLNRLPANRPASVAAALQAYEAQSAGAACPSCAPKP